MIIHIIGQPTTITKANSCFSGKRRFHSSDFLLQTSCKIVNSTFICYVCMFGMYRIIFMIFLANSFIYY